MTDNDRRETTTPHETTDGRRGARPNVDIKTPADTRIDSWLGYRSGRAGRA